MDVLLSVSQSVSTTSYIGRVLPNNEMIWTVLWDLLIMKFDVYWNLFLTTDSHC